MRFPLRLLLPCLLLPAAACGGDEAAAPAAPRPELVTLADVPLTRRNEDRIDPAALELTIGMTGLELGGQGLATLTNGNLAANEVQGGAIPALTRALASSGGRQSAKIELHSMVPYRTLLAVLRTLKAANVQKVGFVVRKGMTPALGVLVPDGFDVRDPSPDPVSFDAPYQRDWDTFVRTWDESFTRCAVDTGFQCTGVPDRAAEGGKVEIGLFTRQDAFVIDVRRFGTDDPPEPILPLLPPQTGSEEEGREQHLPPMARASFYFRRASANVQPESPLALTIRPLCGQSACGIRLSSDEVTPAAQVLVFLGATFPNGTPAPRVIFDASPR
ncbi:MAG: hypothetical protein U0230_01445 [Polyangiales bacterium]